MKLNHVHFQVRDLQAAVDWFGRILQVRPGFRNERIATFSLGAMTVIIDAASADATGTLEFESDDCDADFLAVVDRGAVALEAPRTRNGAFAPLTSGGRAP
jgi:catechol 2,3-dioxygenase-like lactoylglutathione lyase family enzyme